jgi:hypothetical protein
MLILSFLLVLSSLPQSASAQEDEAPIGSLSVYGPTAQVVLPVSDPTTCTFPAPTNWPPLCVLISSAADANGTTAYALSATLIADPDQAYYDADEDLVHPYRGVFVWRGADATASAATGTASLELTATKEGHQTGSLSIAINGLDGVPTGTTLGVTLVSSAP